MWICVFPVFTLTPLNKNTQTLPKWPAIYTDKKQLWRPHRKENNSGALVRGVQNFTGGKPTLYPEDTFSLVHGSVSIMLWLWRDDGQSRKRVTMEKHLVTVCRRLKLRFTFQHENNSCNEVRIRDKWFRSKHFHMFELSSDNSDHNQVEIL